MPADTERGYQKILDKRDVARWYLSTLPHLTKEAFCAIGCAVACGMTVYGYFNNMDLDFAAYATLIGTLVVNELVTLWWRIGRFRRLLSIDRRPAASPAR
jgi:hypothetical protein